MNVNYSDAVMEAWTQTSAKSGFSGASSTVSTCSSSAHILLASGKLRKRDSFPNRQPLRNGGLPGKRRPVHANNNKDKKVSNGNRSENNNGGAGDAKTNSLGAPGGVSLTLKIPTTNEPAQKASRNSKARTHSGLVNGEGRPDVESHSSLRDQDMGELSASQQIVHPHTSQTVAVAAGTQQTRGFHGRPPIKPAPSKSENSFSRLLVAAAPGARRPSPSGHTPRLGSPDLDAQLLLEDSDGRGRSQTLFFVPPAGRGKENSDIQLILSGAGLPVDKILLQKAATTGHNHKSKTFTPRSDSKVPLGKWERRSDGSSTSHSRHCDACAIDNVRQWLRKTASALALEEEADGEKTFFEPLQLIKTVGPEGKDQFSMWMKQQRMEASSRAQKKREQASVHTVTVPKKGLIKLTGLAYEFDNPGYYDNRKERSDRLDQQRFRDEMYGSALPPPPCDLFRGPLIRNKSIMKQVRCGEQRLQAELAQTEERHRTEKATYNTPVGGLLEFEMPEVPNLNNNLQRFLGVPSPAPNINNNGNSNNSNNNNSNSTDNNNASRDQKILQHREKSKSATMTQKQANDVMTPRSVLSERQAHQNPDVIRKNQSESYTPSPLHSPRMAFVTTEFLQNKITATAAGAATHNKQRGRTVKRPPGVDARGQLLQQQQFRAEFGGDERAEEFDDDELYHTMTEYGLYQELGKSNGLYLHNSADDKSKSAKSFMLPELAPY